jgi:hypothetical protein
MCNARSRWRPVGWLPAQQHHGENIGETPTHVIFVELKEPGDPAPAYAGTIGPRD